MNFDANNQESIAQFILDNLPGHKHFVIATTDDTGKPWAVCVNLSYDQDLQFIWKSQRGAEHSKHLSARPDVAICVFSENEQRGDFGLYAKAQAHEITDPAELAHAIQVRYTQNGKPAPDASTLTGDSPVRLYMATLSAAWVNDDRHQKNVVDLQTLRSLAKRLPPPGQ